ncbi:MAG: undecaprenyl-diphosphate phosphatase [Bacteroidales bacterium]|nr:undecaprenyl-diphosphate phosphatase [Bacteroidales bacterium]
MSILETIIIAVIEGLTEFLPVSSTGHMILAQGIMGITSDAFVKAFTIIIQFAAILSVVCIYRKRFFKLNPIPAPMKATALQKIIHKWDFYWKLLIAFIPAAVIGFVGKKSGIIDTFLESVPVVAAMLVAGGVFMLFCDKIFNNGDENTELTEKKAFCIGLFQCIAMIPGVSRSMATIVGGMAQKLTRKKAAEFSFFLAVPTMAAATGLDLLELFLADDKSWATAHNIFLLVLGCVVAFVVAILAIKGFVNFLTKYGFKAFGYYRIIVGGVIIVLLLCGVDLSIVD